MLDISVSYNRYAFMGHEFLTWLWFTIERENGSVTLSDGRRAEMALGNRIVMENRMGSEALETITIKGDDAGLEEAMLALRKGALVSEMNMVFREGDNEWQFTVKGESLHLASVKTPKTGRIGEGDAVEGQLLEKTYLYETAVAAVRSLFQAFVQVRLSDDWQRDTVARMRRWIQDEKPS